MSEQTQQQDGEGRTPLISKETRAKYLANGSKTAKGGKAIDNGDVFSGLVRTNCADESGVIQLDLLRQAYADSGLGDAVATYGHLNVGMQAMNIRNKLRGAFNQGKEVVLGGAAHFDQEARDKQAAKEAEKAEAARVKAEQKAEAKRVADEKKAAEAEANANSDGKKASKGKGGKNKGK